MLERSDDRVLLGFALAGWATLVGAGYLWGNHLNSGGRGLKLLAPPLFGRYDFMPHLAIGIAVALGIVVLVAFERVSTRSSWTWLLLLVGGVAGAWALALALTGGIEQLTEPLLGRSDYLRVLGQVDDLPNFLSTFVDRLPTYTTHVQGHPPGLLIVLWTIERLGLPVAEFAAGLFILAGASSAPASLIALRELAGKEQARRAAPFAAIAPVAVWIATSADALFLGTATWGICLLVLATGRKDPTGDVLALVGGVLIGAALHLSYGIAPLGLVIVAAALARRRVRPLLVGGLGVAVVFGAMAAAGFWWFDGLQATVDRYGSGVASSRPYSYFVFANLSAFAIALGPAVAVGIARLRDSKTWLLVGAGLTAVAVADLSGLSKGEVERIWLPFAPWLLLACAAIPRRQRRFLLGLQIATAIAVQIFVATPW